MSDRSVVRLHYLRLHESPIVNGDDYERFRLPWFLDDQAGSSIPRRIVAAADDEPSSSSASAATWDGIAEGDLVFFPELLSGAGEFEGLRFAGARNEWGIPLLTGGIETPEFPSVIVSFVSERPTAAEGSSGGVSSLSSSLLRNMYERPFEAILSDQGFSMDDLFGGAHEEFWSSPDVSRRTGPPRDDHWVVPLGDCEWIKTLEFEVSSLESGTTPNESEL